jgi:hypothetical protein
LICALAIAGCGGTPREPVATQIAVTPDAGGHLNDPDLNHTPAPKLLAIDWTSVKLASDADALALWNQIAPTGADWQERLDEIPTPSPIRHALALALLRGGNFVCVAPQHVCHAPPDIDPPHPDATFTDPCLRRELALWSIDQLDPEDAPQLRDVLKQLAGLPPPEAQLVADAIQLAGTDSALTFELMATAWKAGQHDLIGGMMSSLDEPHLIEAATKLHIDGAFDVLTAGAQRAVFLGALTDEQLDWKTRFQAMGELADDDVKKLAPDLVKALVAATKSPSCETAAAAAHLLDRHGEHAYVPFKPATTQPDKLIRGLCVTTAYQQQGHPDERNPFTSFVPKRGLELVTVIYDPYSDVDTDGDGDPHTNRTNDLVEPSRAELPDLPDFLGALRHCAKATCSSDDHDFKLVWKNGQLARLEIIEKPPCQNP